MLELLQYLGKFHPVILHLPIGALYFTFCLALADKYFKDNFSVPIRIGLFFSFVSAVISCLLGYFLSLSGEYGEKLLNLHMWLGISTAVLNGFLLWIHYKSLFKNRFLSFFGLTIIILTVTGHFGASMTHGEDFLTPPSFENEVVVELKDSINLYSQVIRPILNNKCVKCHNQSKSKGGLLMDSMDNMISGGKSGNIFVANNSLESHMYNYLVLPMDDDLHMPPEGNRQLKTHEIELIKYWIDSGANFEKFEKTQDSNDELIRNLASFFPKPIATAPPPKISHLQTLQKLNFRVERNSNENNLIEIKFLGEVLENKHIKALLNVKNQLIKLDLSNSNLNDRMIAKLGSLEKLLYLKINDTEISERGLANISKSVVSLNLNNTNIDFESLASFLQKSNVKNVYLWNTNISSDDQKELKNLSSADLNFGIKDFSKNMPLLAPVLLDNKTLFSDSLIIEFYKPPGNPEIRYTTNGKAPDSLSKLYTGPFSINESLTFKAKSFKKGWKSSKTIEVNYFETGGTFEKYKLRESPSKTYSNPSKLFDGVLGSTNFRDGTWNGFLKVSDSESGITNSGDMIVELDLPSKNKIKSIGVNVLTSMNAYITYPENIELYDISSDKESLLSSKKIPKSKIGEVPAMKIYNVQLNKKDVKKVRLVVTSNKKLPKSHVAEGEYAWLFVSEIIGLK